MNAAGEGVIGSIVASALSAAGLQGMQKEQEQTPPKQEQEKEQEPHKTSVQSPESASSSDAAVPSAA